MSRATDTESLLGAAKAVETHGLNPGPWGCPQVVGRCPSCGMRSLFLAVGGHVTCASLRCADPCAAGDLLDPERRS